MPIHPDVCVLLSQLSIFRRESLRLQHGQTFDFSIRVERDLGDVEIVQVHWLYDHEVDPFDLGKICLLFCSDRLFTDRLVVSTVGHSDKRCLHIGFFGSEFACRLVSQRYKCINDFKLWNHLITQNTFAGLCDLGTKAATYCKQALIDFISAGGLEETSLSLCGEEKNGLGFR